MSIQMIRKVRDCISTDQRLTPVDKLILLEYAWNTPEHGAPRQIRYKTYARALGLHRENLRARVRQLTDWGYFEEVAVVVKAGALLQGGWSATPQAKSGGVGEQPLGGRSATPLGGGEQPPLKEKDKKKAGEHVFKRSPALRAPVARPMGGGSALPSLSDLTGYQRTCLYGDNDLSLGNGHFLKRDNPVYQRLQQALRSQDAENERGVA